MTWAESSGRAPHRQPVAASKHRGDIQGLRAVAVLLVALGHAGVGFLKGGFVGVDVFFVVSGFVITGLLLSGAAKHGSVSFTDFYVRRARRILPAAALTLVVTDVVAYQLLNVVRAKQVITDSLPASLFVANVHFAHQGTDYFARAQPPSAILHFWTLAVEEQFYLVWPAILSVVLFGVVRALYGRRGRVTKRALRRVLIVVAVAAIASLAWSIHYTSVLPTASYFSTFSRAWELALGAALAIGTSTAVLDSGTSSLTRGAQAGLGWLGLFGIALAGVMYSSSTPFPGYAALLPTVGTALVIAAGIGDQQSSFAVGRLLAVAPLRYVGDRSYTFYLWHWPALILSVQYAGHEFSVGAKLLLLGGAFLLSIVTYRFFENPIRHADWSPPAGATLGLCSVATVIFVAAFTLNKVDVPPAAPPGLLADTHQAVNAPATISKQSVAATEAGRALPSVIAAVKAARQGARIPSALTPPVGELLNEDYLYAFPSGCVPADSRTSSTICSLGDTSSKKSIVVMGDSHAQMWMPTILSMAERDGWVVRPVIKSGCTPDMWIGQSAFGARPTAVPTMSQCRAWYRWAVREARALHPDVTLVTGCCGGGIGTGAQWLETAQISLATAMKPFSRSVVLIGDDDGIGQEPVDCLLARHATMRSCTTTWTEERFGVNDDIAARARIAGLGFLRTRGWFCFEYDCPMVVGHTIVYRDKDHITQPYALELAQPFRAAFRRAIGSAKTRP